ncbi:MAG TPA: Uma2 family endonuclease [Solirubrobacteraceae bacterium]|nr:Uma2 family endonuclease [Solirubrobacteraceae bacterium]
MVESGALHDEPVELLDGLLVHMSPQGIGHAEVIERLTRHLAVAQAWLRVQLPLEIPPTSMPEPDLALVDRRPPGHHPNTALLAVEVAVTSQSLDRGVKSGLYAAADIPSYWLVDVPARAIELRTDPGLEGYRSLRVYTLGESIPSPAPGVADLDVSWLFKSSAPR